MREFFTDFVKIKELDENDRSHISSIGIDVFNFYDCYILPGFTDVHVHLREPGFLYKETIRTGTAAAAAGGFTNVFAMPNLNPCPDNMDKLRVQLDAIEKSAFVNVYPYGAITVDEAGVKPADFENLAEHVIAFTDDGKGVASQSMMLDAMMKAKNLDKIIVAHCEDESYPKESAEAEWKQLERDIALVRQTGCSYHACHLSTKESVQLIRAAKAEGLDITCETAPHYLTITNDEIEDDGRFKMNPPIKNAADRAALIEGIRDGTIDMIATDHAPHSAEEKSKGFADSAFGIVGLETAFPVLYSRLVKRDIISPEKLVEMLYMAPGKRFGLDVCSMKEELMKEKPTFALWDLDTKYRIEPEKFLSKGRSTPFGGWEVQGRCMLTVANGIIIQEYKNERHHIYDTVK